MATHTKISHLEHILKIPDTYIGDIDESTTEMWCFDETVNKMIKKKITYIPGMYKLFDEIIVNSFDQYIRIKESGDSDQMPVKNVKINVNKETGEISVYNDGEGIPIEIHPKEKIYIPELIFGELLTSSNYDEKKIKHVGGKNGYGAKLANIFSTKFTITTVDRKRGKKFTMNFYDNKSRKDKPKITACKSKPYTEITYTADFKRFNTKGVSDDMIELIKKRAYEVAACSENALNVYFNGQKLEIKNFEKYIKLFIDDSCKFAYEKVNERWEIGCALSPNLSFDQVSFVNGINTMRGGKHVDYVMKQITDKLCEFIKKKKKVEVNGNYIKENLIVFIKSTIDDPKFDSQTKETLTSNKSKFGSKCEPSSKFIDTLAKCGIIEKAMLLSQAKQDKALSKTDGKKKNRITGIPKLEDANWAGTKKSSQCTLILTEGDSAKSTAMAGIEIIGRDKYGVFPLKGKLINVKDKNNAKKLLQNTELANIKKILGLENNKTYKNIDEIRYGKILILTDQDEDGSHIKGLVFTLFEKLWPSLFKMKGFINSMLTPIVKAINKKEIHEFYSFKDYEKFAKEFPDLAKTLNVKYYKGLATSTPKEAKEYFRQLKMVEYTTNHPEDITALNLAFDKEKQSADMRKKWLGKYDRNNTLDYTDSVVPIRDFINRDLIHFSNSDNVRSIPSMVDGLKPGQRKVMFGCFKRNLVNEIKVAQLAGYVSENSAYHHGEASLAGTIVNLAQEFVASNNIALLDGVGQFGTRIQGGKDAGQPRYIFTRLASITTKIFSKLDTPLLKDNYDDGMKVEPEYYIPMMPMILVNGASGIGTGWSTDIPSYNPEEIRKNIIRSLNGQDLEPMNPWYNGFKGTITKLSNNSYLTKGVYTIEGNKLIVTELPIGKWTQKFQDELEDMMNNPKNTLVRYYNSYCTDTKVHYVIVCDENELFDLDIYDQQYGMTTMEYHFKLYSKISTSNMYLYDSNIKLKKYNNELEILEDYLQVRSKFYGDRITYIINELIKTLDVLEYKMKFIKEFIDETIKIIRVKKVDIISQLKERNYPEVEGTYDYLIKMHIYNLSEDKIDELQNQIDDKNAELVTMKKETVKSFWTRELEDLKFTDNNAVIKMKFSKKTNKKTNKKN